MSANRPGRALRAHQRIMSRPRDASDVRHEAALKQALAETHAKYPTITVDNAQEALDFQARRIRELQS